MHNTFTLPGKTYIDLDQPEVYKQFMQGYLVLLRSNLQQYKVMDQKGDLLEIRYSCGQNHDPQNPNWKPFKYLEYYCRKCGYDDMVAQAIIEEHIGRGLGCECQLLAG
jgi:hypothetical protein